MRSFECLPFRFVDIRAHAFFDTRPLGYTYAIERQLVLRSDAEEIGARLADFQAPTAPLPLEFSSPPVGHGECPGGEGHCDPDQQTGRELRPPHHRTPFDTFVDVTARLREVVPKGPVYAQMLVVDYDDNMLPTDTVAFDNVSMTYR